jgi:1-acyl-sn-glycerol-3-phosphate acyltransferase
VGQKKTPVWGRLARLTSLCVHLGRGLLIAWLRFPRLSPAGRAEDKRRWSRKLLAILSVTVRETTPAPDLPGRCMLVLNHISWLDIFVVDAVLPATFVAKSEIRSWPIVGSLCTLVGTIYIERGKRAAARNARGVIAAELANGTLVAICPEGTTTFGDSLERFHAALFQPAIDADAAVQPVALRYVDLTGSRTDAAGYVGETSFLESLWTILSTPHMTAEITYTKAFMVSGEDRRAVADRAERAIAGALQIPWPRAPHSAPE